MSSSAVAEHEITPHTTWDDVIGILTGACIASLGIFLLKSSTVVTGGTAGLSLLLNYFSGRSFSIIFVVVNVPFLALAAWKKGWAFTGRTLVSVTLVSFLAHVHSNAFGPLSLAPSYAAVAGNLLMGVGMLILFRHGSSLGGFNIIALLAQERLGWRAGYVQLAMDAIILLAATAVVSPLQVVMSTFGAVVLNISLATNHRPGRYLG